MYLDKDDFNEGLMKSFHKIRKKHGEVLANIFITIADQKLKIKDIDFRNMSDTDYQLWLDVFIDTLSRIKITRVDKNSPDGLMLTQMASE